MSARPERAPEACAVCGNSLSPTAQACPDCGADERTGWRESSIYDGIELPDVAAPDAEDARQTAGGLPWYWLAVAALLLLLLGFSVLSLR